MKLCRIHIFQTIMLLALAACSGGSATVGQQIADAEEAVSSGYYETGQKICAHLVADTASLTVGQLCRMGVIYATIADNDVDRESNMASAAHMLEIASQRNADSVSSFINGIPYELQAPVRTALRISQIPTDSILGIPVHDEPDGEYDAEIHGDGHSGEASDRDGHLPL